MNRLLNLLEYSLFSLHRRWKKHLLFTLIYTIIVSFFASIIFLTTSLKYLTDETLESIPDLWIQKVEGGRLVSMDMSLADSLKNFRGVQKVIPRIWGYYYDSPTAAVFTVIASDSLFPADLLFRIDNDFIPDSTSALCGTGFLELHGLNVGDRLNLIDNKGELVSYRIGNSFRSASDLLTRDLIILSPDAVRKIIGLDNNEVTDIALKIANSDEVEMIGVKINRKYPGIRIVSKEQIKITYDALFSWRGGLFMFGAIFSLLAFLVLGWDRASGLSRQESKELGILKGVGWQINDILWIKFWEGAIISLTATLWGIFIAYLHIFTFNAFFLKGFFIGWSVLYPDFNLPVIIYFSDFLMIFLLSVIPYLSATIIPAWKGAITDPAEVMQS
ncbi:ABC transporter permease [bacterium]|nr:ABC transporter permease [bacterium]